MQPVSDLYCSQITSLLTFLIKTKGFYEVHVQHVFLFSKIMCSNDVFKIIMSISVQTRYQFLFQINYFQHMFMVLSLIKNHTLDFKLFYSYSINMR